MSVLSSEDAGDDGGAATRHPSQKGDEDRGKTLLLSGVRGEPGVRGENAQAAPNQLHLLTSPSHVLPALTTEMCLDSR